MNQLVRYGLEATVAAFRPIDASRHARGSRVVLRTERGLEIGEVLEEVTPSAQTAGELLRRMTVADELLAERLERNRHAAAEACVGLLAERGSSSTLLDVEQLFDGGSLCFHFWGPVDAIAEAAADELARAYDARAKIDAFAQSLEEGCGPGCGTSAAKGGCGTSGGCAGCGVAAACSTGRASTG